MRAEASFIVVSQRSTSLLCAEMAIEEFGKLAAERLKIGPVVLGALLVEVDSDGSGAIDAQEFNRVGRESFRSDQRLRSSAPGNTRSNPGMGADMARHRRTHELELQ